MKPESPYVITLNCVLLVVCSVVKIHSFYHSSFSSLTAESSKYAWYNQTHPFVKMKLDIESLIN